MRFIKTFGSVLPLLVFSGNLIGYIIVLPAEVVLLVTTMKLLPA